MADENSKLRNEIIELKEKLGHFEKEIGKLNARNADLEEQNKVMKAEKSEQQANPGQSVDIAKKRVIKEEKESDNFTEQMAGKRAKLSEICVPNWLIEVLAWIGRIEMANSSLPTSSRTFRQLCWPKLHGNVKPHKTPKLEFFECRFELGQVRALLRVKNKYIPIASIPPPDYIVGVKKIELSFVDGQVLAFIKIIAQLIQSCVFSFNSPIIQWKQNQKGVKEMKMVLECLGDKIVGFDLQGSLQKFNCIFPGIVESMPAIAYSRYDLDVDFLVECLTKQQNNGKQIIKLLANSNQEFMVSLIDGIKKKFSESIMPSLFFFCFHSRTDVDEFTLENEQTNEILILYSRRELQNGSTSIFYLARYPKGEKEYWTEEGEEKTWQQIKAFSSFNNPSKTTIIA